MRRFMGLAALVLLASAAKAQDTIVVIVRHIPAQQAPAVVVRPLAPAAPRYAAPQYGAPRYAPGATAVFAKDPYVGTMLSVLFPGGGQFYGGATSKGLAISLIGIGAPIIGFANVNRDRRNYNYNGFGPPPPGNNCAAYAGGPAFSGGGGQECRGRYDWTPAAIGLGVGVTAWLYGVVTAGTDVQHWNQAHGVRFMTAPGRAGFAVALP